MGKGLRAGFQNARQTLARAIKVSKKDVEKEPAVCPLVGCNLCKYCGKQGCRKGGGNRSNCSTLSRDYTVKKNRAYNSKNLLELP